mmetsp:Transcript_44597/g.49990  ORF Transcript_44597/g.49990 Transcript_44597/m.49990 type:complete len:135 (+) Transcript_44597:277-681(+)
MIIRRDDDVSRGSINVDDDECCLSRERSVGKAKNDRSSFSPPSLSWWNEVDDEDEDENNDFRGTNGGGDNNENDDDDGDNEDKDDLRFLVGDAKDDDGNKVEEFGEWLLIIMISSSLSTTSCTRPSWCVWKSSR